MGGDGGTLNNSRAEHVALRRSVQTTPGTSSAHQKSRASVTECSLSGTPLHASETVVDRVGQLYNKEALLKHLLTRGRGAADDGRLPHVRKFARDVADVKWTTDPKSGQFLCAVTRDIVYADGAFSVGWRCGCVTAPVDARGAKVRPEDARVCANCGAEGDRVELGQTVAQRAEGIRLIVEGRKSAKKSRKRGDSGVLEGGVKKAKKTKSNQRIERKENTIAVSET